MYPFMTFVWTALVLLIGGEEEALRFGCALSFLRQQGVQPAAALTGMNMLCAAEQGDRSYWTE